MTTLVLVRHGLTPHTGHKLSGWMPGINLNDQGRGQARRVGEALRGLPFDALYSSPIDRCVETARAIATQIGLRPRIREALGDTDYGDWTNRSLRPLTRTRLWRTLERFPSAARFPGGETLRETQTRVLDEIERIIEAHPGRLVCVVSHADPIRLTVAHYIGVHIDHFQRIQIPPATVTVLHVGERGPHLTMLGGGPEGLAGLRP